MKPLTEIAAKLAARLSGKQKAQLAGALECVLSIIPDMAEYAKLQNEVEQLKRNDFLSAGERDVLAERAKQREKWGAAHDRGHGMHQLVWASMYYASPTTPLADALFQNTGWDACHAKATDNIGSNLVIAAALLIAELDRLDELSGDSCSTPTESESEKLNMELEGRHQRVSCQDCIGTGDCSYSIMLPYFVRKKGETQITPEAKTVSIDKCLLPEVLELWEAGIRTNSVCCGHGEISRRHIIVDDADIQRMLDMGYRPQRLMEGATAAYFLPKTPAFFYTDVNKGFNWWTERAPTIEDHKRNCTPEKGCRYGEDADCPASPRDSGYAVEVSVHNLDMLTGLLQGRGLFLRVDVTKKNELVKLIKHI